MRQTGSTLLWIILGIGILGMLFYAAIFLTQGPLIVRNNPSPSPDLHSQAAEMALKDIHYFPIYPQAWFVKKEATLPCPSVMISGYTECGSIAYRWQTSDRIAKVQNWYSSEKLKTYGWKMTGGAGSQGSISHQTWQNLVSGDKVTVTIVNDRDNDLPTISVLLPNGDPDLFEATSSADIQNWINYRNPALKFELKYPSYFAIDEKAGLVVFYNGGKRLVPTNSPLEPYDRSAMAIYDRGTTCSAECNNFPTVKKILNGYPVVLNTEKSGNGQDFWISNKEKNKSLRFIYTTNQEFEKDLPIYQQILSTFKFID